MRVKRSISFIFVFIMLFNQMNLDISNAAVNGTPGLNMKVTDIKGEKPQYIGNNTILTEEKDIEINGEAILSFKAQGQSTELKNMEYKFFKQINTPDDRDFSIEGGWNKIGYNEFIDNDVITNKPGFLTWRSYNVDHMPTMSNSYRNWSNRSDVYENPNNRIQFQSTKTSQTVEEYIPGGGTTRSVFMKPMNIGARGGIYPDYKESSKFWGYIKPEKSGTYYFGISSDDGSYGYIIDNDGEEKEIVSRTSTIDRRYPGAGFFYPHSTMWSTKNEGVKLTAGKYYPIYLEYFNWGGEAHFELYYNRNRQINPHNRSKVPSNWFYPSKTDTPGELAESTFNIDYTVDFPTEPGMYYIGVRGGENKGVYGPFKISPKAPINLTKEAEKNQYLINEEFTLDYRIQPQPIPSDLIVPESYMQDKEIVLVMDTSGSMAADINSDVYNTYGGLSYTKDNNDNNVYYEFDNGIIKYYREEEFDNYYKDWFGRKKWYRDKRNVYYELHTDENSSYYKDKDGNILKPRLTLAKSAAKNFINKLKDEKNIKVSLLSYSDRGHVLSPWTSINDDSGYNNIIKKIENMLPEGGTNIGDGLRKAYYQFDNGNKASRKYIILLTDGEPTYHSYIEYGSWLNYDWEYYFGKGNDYHVDGGGNEATERDKEYANKVARDLILKGDYDIDSFMIAFSNGANRNILKEIAASGEGYYKQALDGNALDVVYQELAKQIQSDLPIHGISFEETFPEGIDIISANKGLEISGQRVMGDIGSISYVLNGDTKQFEADPFDFSIKLRANKVGNYTLGEDGNGDVVSHIEYEDIDGTLGRKAFPGIDIAVYENEPPEIEATLVYDSSNEDEYSLDFTIDEPANIYVQRADGHTLWTKDERDENYSSTKSFNIDLNKNDIRDNYIVIKALDRFENEVVETVPIINIEAFTIDSTKENDYEPLAELEIETETNSKVEEIKINNEVIAKDRLTDSGRYKHIFGLEDGVNDIEIKVINDFGNKGKLIIGEIIDNRPPAPPVISIDPEELTNEDVTVNIDYPKDAINKYFKIGKDGSWMNYDGKFTVDENVTIYAKGSDATGNESDISKYVIDNIDKIPPDAPIIKTNVDMPAYSNVVVDITYPADAYSKKYKIDNREWQDYNGNIEISNSGIIYAKCFDEAGNESEKVKKNILIKPYSKIDIRTSENKREISVIPQGKFIAKIEFEVTKNINKAEVILESDIENLDIRFIELLKEGKKVTDIVTIEENRIIFPENINPGDYECYLEFDINESNMDSGTQSLLRIDKLNIKETSESSSIEFLEDNKPTLTINIVDLPKIL